MIKFVVGTSTFSVYADFVRWHCPMLAEEKEHMRGRSSIHRSLEGVDAEVFGLFVSWLYTERVINKRGDPPFQQRCVGLWILGNRLQLPKLSNDALNALEARRRKEGAFQTKAFHYIYNNTKEGAPLRRYVTDVCAFFMPNLTEREKSEHFPEELNQDIFLASLIRRIKPENEEIDPTAYYLTVEP